MPDIRTEALVKTGAVTARRVLSRWIADRQRFGDAAYDITKADAQDLEQKLTEWAMSRMARVP